jgi:hypothetical protein
MHFISQCCLYRACLSHYCLQIGPTPSTYLYSQATFRRFGGGHYHHQGRKHPRPKNAAHSSCLTCHTSLYRVIHRSHPGYCTAEVGNAGGSYELPCISRPPSTQSCLYHISHVLVLSILSETVISLHHSRAVYKEFSKRWTEYYVAEDVIGRYAAIDVVGCTERSLVLALYSPKWESQSNGMIGHHEAMQTWVDSASSCTLRIRVDRLSAGISRFHVEISTGVTLLMFQIRTELPSRITDWCERMEGETMNKT